MKFDGNFSLHDERALFLINLITYFIINDFEAIISGKKKSLILSVVIDNVPG